MHAAIHQLLSLRDGAPVDAPIARHVEQCAECSAELARLERVQQRLQSLPAIEPPADAWQRIADRVSVPEIQRRSRVSWAIAAAIVVAVASGLIVREVRAPDEPLPAVQLQTPSAPAKPASISLEQLVAQSQELDQMLQYLPERPVVERVALAATLDTIEARVQWLDQQLSYDTDLDDVRETQLWRERVDLMDSLVKVRYAEGAPMSF
ncbi:MAG TPA: hypothetical protein PKE27_01465 [Povalibacter sp.]|uniref:hypothetical protein n=1 Tax=Povalibacter sp. TaxID=1962978 RepID=UPI002C0F1BC7|nr:hypothetical protein [Povalibacter sp.]HMN43218.1 hypothetical protein [Povalibacter sp.]